MGVKRTTQFRRCSWNLKPNACKSSDEVCIKSLGTNQAHVIIPFPPEHPNLVHLPRAMCAARTSVHLLSLPYTHASFVPKPNLTHSHRDTLASAHTRAKPQASHARTLSHALSVSLSPAGLHHCARRRIPRLSRPLLWFRSRRISGGLPWHRAGRRSPEFRLPSRRILINFRFWSEEHGSGRKRCLSSDWGLQGGILGGIGELEATCSIISWMEIDSPFSRWHKKVIVISWNFSLTICFGGKLSWKKYFRRKFWGNLFPVKR